jgi:hypothetical protein
MGNSLLFSQMTELNETTSEKKDEVMGFIIVKIPHDNLKEAIFQNFTEHH